MNPSSSTETIFDLVGLGFGPANIAIAGALTESWQATDVRSIVSATATPIKNVLFIEKHKTFRWHPGMLLPEAKMQISFMKDLATLRNPQSPYTFISYLHSQDRLISFINRGSTIPTRKEYSDYLTWAASQVQKNGVNVLYGHEIVSIEEGVDDTVSIRYRDLSSGNETVIRARNIVISPGGSPRVPTFLAPHTTNPRVIHSSAYATSIGAILDSLKVSRPLRVAVIGSGQSAAEVTLDLRSRLSAIPVAGRHEIEMLIRKGSLKPSDDSPFANEIFDPASTDAWFALPSKRLRDIKLAEYKLTNYGVVNPLTLDNLYEVVYDQRLDESIARRIGSPVMRDEAIITISPYTSITSITAPEESGKGTFIVQTVSLISGSTSSQEYDFILYATGYERSQWVNLLKRSEIGAHFGLNAKTSSVQLVPSHQRVAAPRPVRAQHTHASPTSSAESTPPSSPEPGIFSSMELERDAHQEVYITRNYRLLPHGKGGEEKHFQPKIYVQGVEETTHGLSDTLLSVLGVRAGEVVADLMGA
ncbi:hypothetical protein CVT24_007744 [Panaeolus cyanescens]|uniref:L-ornithine N(5)-monooxygenase [NAD(P)H] n=1 Tax=Panaeolus cyanescens TaxID=181874 RepID=A0A409YKS4_9AGAR|nr:hypothetical protein CVT24_007744 [Panaeolus cyanescens]